MAIRRRRQTAAERLDRLIELQALLADVSRKIGPALELSPVLQTVLSAMRSMVEFRGGTIQLIDERGVYIAAADPLVSPDLAATRVPLGTGLSGRAIVTRTTIYAPDLDTDPRVDPVQRRTGNNATTHSYLVVPLIVLGSCIGAIQVDSDEIDAFEADDITVLEGLATQVAGAIEGARRYEEVLELKRLKDDFIALISHELRTPLTIMSGFTETLLQSDQALSPDSRRDALNRIKVGVDRFRGLVEDILYVSSLDAGVTQPAPGELSLPALVAQVRERSIDPSRVVVEVPPGRKVVADRIVLGHILNQLVDNALKYGGDAVIEVGPDTDGEVVVSVRDHGPGVPPDHRELVFERFWRGLHAGAGMGLGLATVRQLAASIGASVDISDPPGGGTRMNVRLPRPAAKPVRKPVSKPVRKGARP